MPLAQNNGFFAPTSTSTSTSTSSVDANGSGSCSQHQQQPTHPHIKTERPLEAPVQSNANLGQLLNPVHPLHSESTPQPLFSTSQSYPNYSATDRTDELKPTSVTTTDPTPLPHLHLLLFQLLLQHLQIHLLHILVVVAA